MLREFFCEGSCGQRAWALLGLTVFVGHQFFKGYLSWAINGWYERFYDVLQTNLEFGSGAQDSGSEDVAGELRARVSRELVEFAWIVAPAVVVNPLAGLVRNWWVFTWRRTLMKSYLHRWNSQIPPIEGASQRVHEDTQRFAAGIQTCLSVVLEAFLTLAIFCPVLYGLDPTLMLVAVAAATGGLSVSVVVGWPLVGLEVNNQKVEAELRKRLVLLEAEPREVHVAATPYLSFVRVVHDLAANYRRLYLSFAALACWLSAYEQVAVILPYLLAAPRLFAADPARRFTLGKLVKLSNAFGKVFDSLNIVSDRWLQINEWRSCLRRLREFEAEVSTRSPGGSARLAPSGAHELADVVEIVDPAMQPGPVEPQDPTWTVCGRT